MMDWLIEELTHWLIDDIPEMAKLIEETGQAEGLYGQLSLLQATPGVIKYKII